MTPGSGGKLLLAAGAVVVAVVIISSLVLVGPPSVQRQRKVDAARVRDLQGIERFVTGYARLHKALPADMGALAAEPGYHVPLKDSEDGEQYEYALLGADSYRLCATFKTASDSETALNSYGLAQDATWAHGIGRQCFDRHADISPK
jgi:hypothetical protein